MTHHGWEFAAELESRLYEGLPALRCIAGEMGAASVSVLVVKNGRSIESLYGWPNPSNQRADALPLEDSIANALRDLAGYVPESSPIANYLNTAFSAAGASFLLFSWGTQRLNAIVAFGFTAPIAPAAQHASNIPPVVKLASVAAWSVCEAVRLHSEVVIVNERLSKRKMIERAKGLLQLERGLDEQQAYEHLRKLSRQRRMRMSDVAKDLLGTSHFP